MWHRSILTGMSGPDKFTACSRHQYICLVDWVGLPTYIPSFLCPRSKFSPPKARMFPMSPPSSPALQRLHNLNRSLPDFDCQLHDILYGHVRTRSDTTPVNPDPVLTRYVSPCSRFPLVLVPTPYPLPLHPTSDYASFVGTPIPFRMFPFVLVSLRTMSSFFSTPDSYLQQIARTCSGLPSDLGRLMSPLVT